MKTAEEILKEWGVVNQIDGSNLSGAVEAMIEFAKQHCTEQAKVISENVEADFEPMGWLADHHLNDPFIAGEDYEIPVSRQSILNAYPLNLIK